MCLISVYYSADSDSFLSLIALIKYAKFDNGRELIDTREGTTYKINK